MLFVIECYLKTHCLFCSHSSTSRLRYCHMMVSTDGQLIWESFPFSILIVFENRSKGFMSMSSACAIMTVPANHQKGALVRHGGSPSSLGREILPWKKDTTWNVKRMWLRQNPKVPKYTNLPPLPRLKVVDGNTSWFPSSSCNNLGDLAIFFYNSAINS